MIKLCFLTDDNFDEQKFQNQFVTFAELTCKTEICNKKVLILLYMPHMMYRLGEALGVKYKAWAPKKKTPQGHATSTHIIFCVK